MAFHIDTRLVLSAASASIYERAICTEAATLQIWGYVDSDHSASKHKNNVILRAMGG